LKMAELSVPAIGFCRFGASAYVVTPFCGREPEEEVRAVHACLRAL
jgi:hypothetical protein